MKKLKKSKKKFHARKGGKKHKLSKEQGRKLAQAMRNKKEPTNG